MKYTILLFATFLFFRMSANAQTRDSYKFMPEKKQNPMPMSVTVEKEKILYLIDSVYYDNDSTTALASPPLLFYKDSTKKYSSVFD